MITEILIRQEQQPTFNFRQMEYWRKGDDVDSLGFIIRKKGWLLEIDGDAEVISAPATQAA